MTTIEDFFDNVGRRLKKPPVAPGPYTGAVPVGTPQRAGRTRRFIGRVIIVILLLLLVFFARFIPLSWNPFGSSGIFAAESSANGPSGDGPAAVPGATSSPGPQGANGASGADGIQGPQGPRGRDGASGANGVNGAPGAKGETGATGPAGAVGPMGPVGSLGQSNSDISACDDNIVVGLRSGWSTSDQEFRVSKVLMTDVSDACSGLYLGFDLLDAAGESLAHIEVSSITVSDGVVTLTASDFPLLTSVRSVDVARVAMEIAS